MYTVSRSAAALTFSGVGASSRACAMACPLPPPLHLLCGCTLAALLALHVNAVRLDGKAIVSDGSMVGALAARTSVPLAPGSVAARAQRDRDLRAASDYIDSIAVQDYLHLGNIKDILERFEYIRERVLSFGAARDPRHRLHIRKILREVKDQGEALKVLAGEFEADGEVDDGGDELPTQRNNICNRFSNYRVEKGFFALVQMFCETLDSVRKAVNAGEDEEPMAYCVSGVLSTMAMKPDFTKGHIGLEIEEVLGEERRWVGKHLAPRPAGMGDDLPSPEGTKTRFRRWALRAWETSIWADVEVDTADLPFNALKKAHQALASATVEDDLTLGSLRTRIQRLEFCKFGLARFITRSDPSFRERVRDVLQDIKARMDALGALSARKVAAGEVDNSGEMLPSQRNNLCRKLDGFDLEGDFREDVQKICETFDRLHFISKIDPEKDPSVFELLGRISAMRRRQGYFDTPVALEVENLVAEEWGWLDQRGAFVEI